MLGATRSELVGRKLQSSVEVVDLDIFDQTKEVKVEEKRSICVEKLFNQHCFYIKFTTSGYDVCPS